MKFEFQYTSKSFFKRLILSYLFFIVIGLGTLLFYGSIEPGTKEINYFILIQIGIPLLIFVSGIKKYGVNGYIIFNKETVEISVHNTVYNLNYVEVIKLDSYLRRGFHVKIKTKKDLIKIGASYFADESQLMKAYDEFNTRLVLTQQTQSN